MLNAPTHDIYLPDKRARRETPPKYPGSVYEDPAAEMRKKYAEKRKKKGKSNMPERKSMSQERDYASTAAAVTVKQHQRLHDQATAIIQSASWMRESDLTPPEMALVGAAQEFLSKKEAAA